MTEPQPLILITLKNGEYDFLLPNDKKELRIPKNATITLSCPGKGNHLQNFKTSSIEATCVDGKKFLVNQTIYHFTFFACDKMPKETVRRINDQDRNQCRYQSYEIGFLHQNDHFVQLFEICRNDKTYRTHYVKSNINRDVLGYQSGYPRPFWKYGEHYDPYNMSEIYKIDSQMRSLKLQLGSADLAKRYVKTGKQYLNRGHLAAKADFVYGSQQSASFWLLNSAPQWSSFNSGNWLSVENAARKYARENKIDIEVYTGVHGTTNLIDVNGNKQDIYLYAHENGARAIPVPRFFWKVLHDRTSGSGLAFVGLNEPYAQNVTNDMYLCPDISNEELDYWIGWDPLNIEKGVSYLCMVQELSRVVPDVPKFGVEIKKFIPDLDY